MNKYQASIIFRALNAGVMRPLLLSTVFLATFPLPQTDSKGTSWADNQYIALLIINKSNNLILDFINSLNIALKDNPQKIIITIVYTLTFKLTTCRLYNKDIQGILNVR